eukprot:CAMPEP_0194770842 /NCGR_PEP_ID=MMETSP0323_2-20130528/47390_1 /TAXON_ID=2866 ORGANISM="Crypthecodinium cohnii, Strain Seligo" /NCGR_SAMPLE_ID=MMETSP0323_2 /ASSEMBLY_ACC=CAM_ASM_000346 /LENGTH=34 /DNA_ID= /DNA_START= /DNA_END= /DNA_ORIENTATION=
MVMAGYVKPSKHGHDEDLRPCGGGKAAPVKLAVV